MLDERRYLLEQTELIGMSRADGYPPVMAFIDAVAEASVTLRKHVQSFLAARWVPSPLPDLVKASRVAAISRPNVLASHMQPAGDPDVDGILFGERALRRGSFGWSDQHRDAETLDERNRNGLIARNSYEVMAAVSRPRKTVMILFPAIDLKDGQCVRLKRGDMNEATVFNDDPAAQALIFERQAFAWLHLVDLNGAFAGEPVNAAAVEAILSAITIPVQLGGGIRDLKTIEGWLAKGIRRVILGTAAVRDPTLVREACRLHPGRIAVGIDAKGGKVAVEGWGETSELLAPDLARRFEDAGVAAIIYTDIDRDGVLAGLNLPATVELARSTSIPVIASGGLASMADIEALTRLEYAMLEGAITGRALYDGRIDATAALAMLKRAA